MIRLYSDNKAPIEKKLFSVLHAAKARNDQVPESEDKLRMTSSSFRTSGTTTIGDQFELITWLVIKE